MRSYLSLVPLSAKVHKRQNRMTLICIILSVFLITAIFSMTDIWVEGEKNAMIKKHGDYHISLSGISETDAGLIAGQEDIAVFTWRRALNNKDLDETYHIADKILTVYGSEQPYLGDIRNYEMEGRYPQNDAEVMLSSGAKESLGASVGGSVTLYTPAGGFDYTVSGFCTGIEDEEWNASIDGVCAYLNAGGFERLVPAGDETAQKVYYVRFAKNAKLKEAIADLKGQYGLDDRNIKENTAVLGMMGASSRDSVKGVYPLAVGVFVFVLIAGALMISSCINSSVSQRTQFFGMLRCIGAGKKQVMHYVRLEALNWCKSAIPIGCLLGTAATWVMCVFLSRMVGGEFSDLSFRPSIFGILFGMAVGIITVLVAVHSPARRAAGVSPVEAVSGNTNAGRGISHAANTRLFKVETALGIHHAAGAKKNLILMTLSFAFTVILFFTFFAFLDFARALLPSLSDFTPDISISSADYTTNSIDKRLADEIASIPGVENAFGNAYALETPAQINGTQSVIDLISYESYMLDCAKKSVVSGDIAKVTDGSGYAMTIYNQGSSLDVGDIITIGDVQLELACVVSEGIGGYGRPLVICTEKTFERITGEDGYIMLHAQLEKDVTEATVNAIRALAGEHYFVDRREENAQNHSSYWVFRIAAYGFLAIIALITVFNIMNSISMSVSARIKQYGTMRAVGMSVRQVTKMIASEAITYAVCGLFIGCAAGLLFHRLIITKLIIKHFGGHWQIPLQPIAVIVPIVVFSCIAAVHKPAKRIRNMAVTETINEL